MAKRNRSKQTLSLKDRFAIFANKLRTKAAALSSGSEQDALLGNASQADATVEDWLHPLPSQT
jgi:hypothetical protein